MASNVIKNKDSYEVVVDCDSTGWNNSGNGGLGTTDVIGSSKTEIKGNFEAVPTNTNSDNPYRGFARINVDIYYNGGISASASPEDRAEVHLQTGVSIMDYTRENGVLNN